MNTNNTSSLSLGLAFIGLVIVSLAGIALLAVLADELAENGWAVPNLMQAFFAYLETWQNSTGNEFTGEATAWLFGASSVPVGVDLISRTVIRYAPLGQRVKGIIRRINNLQRKYLMPLHTYLSILALGLGILHLTLSSCVANPFPELGLILTGILVATGLLFKWKAVPSKLRKTLYQFHASLIVSGILLVILFTGHAVMGLD
jgi:predicted ferric reductase